MRAGQPWCVRLVLVLAAAVVSACASTGRSGSVTDRFIKQGTPSISYGDPVALEDSLKVAIAKIRALAQNAHPRAKNITAATLEANHSALAAALRALAQEASAETHFAVANLYVEIGVKDRALEHFEATLQFDRASGAAYEGMARIWRDWGLPDVALADAHRAVYYEPQSAAARNTLGTIFQALGRLDAARTAYIDAVWLNPGAAYALNNLCYLSLHRGSMAQAKEECELALLVDPTLRVARFNVAQVYDRMGLAARADEQRRVANDPVMADFHEGLLRRNRREYAAAADAFERACLARPAFTDACTSAADLETLAQADTREK